LRLCERGGKNAKKRAAVAVARKLAVFDGSPNNPRFITAVMDLGI
jgi:hypothetical protein